MPKLSASETGVAPHLQRLLDGAAEGRFSLILEKPGSLNLGDLREIGSGVVIVVRDTLSDGGPDKFFAHQLAPLLGAVDTVMIATDREDGPDISTYVAAASRATRGDLVALIESHPSTTTAWTEFVEVFTSRPAVIVAL